MKLSILHMLLEEAQFKHTRADFLSLPAPEPGEEPVQAPVNVRVDLANGESGKDFAVRLRVVSEAEEAPYAFVVSYLVLLSLDLEGASPPDDLPKRLMVTGATMALPFVREVVANLTMRGRFGPTWVAPTDFNTLLKNSPLPVRTEPVTR